MILSEYQAKREDLEKEMQALNEAESEKKMELSIKYQAGVKKIQAQIGNLKHKQRELLKNYQNDKAWWHKKFSTEKRAVSLAMHTLRLAYLTVDGPGQNTPPHYRRAA